MSFQVVNLSNVVAATITATSEATNYPASRMALTTPPYVRGWRSTGTSSQTLTVTFGSSNALVGCVIYDANFTAVSINGSDYTIQKDPWDSLGSSRYKIWIPLSVTASSRSVVIPSQSTTDGAGYFKLGKVHFFTVITELQQNPRPEMGITLIDPQMTTESENGSVFESLPAGPAFIREEWSWLGQHSYATELFTVAGIGAHQPFLLYHDLDNDYETYYMQRLGGVQIQRGNATHDIAMTLRQIP
jgi:hypothetical protein